MNKFKKPIFIVVSLLLCIAAPLQLVKAEDEVDLKNSSHPFSAKDEVVYGNLDANGKIKQLYVVNSFDLEQPGKIIDYGTYTKVRNLTDLSEIHIERENEVHFQTEEETFYYQGELADAELPWEMTFTYVLDGEEITPESLAGKSGALEIRIDIKQNKNVNPIFFEHYVVQINATFDPLHFANLHAPKGTEAKEGKNKQIAFNVMPESEEVFIITAEVTNMEMEPIQLTAVPANFAIDSPDTDQMTKDMDELSRAIQEINDAVATLQDGTAELAEGAFDIEFGSGEFRTGLNELDANSAELVDGSKEIKRALDQIHKGMGSTPPSIDFSDLTKLSAGLKEIAKNVRQIAGGLEQLRKNYSEAHNALKGTIQQIPSNTISNSELKKLQESNANKKVIGQLVETYEAAQRVKATYNQTKAAFDAVTSTLSDVTSPLYELAKELDNIARSLEEGADGLKDLEALGQLQSGLTKLAKEYESFHNGLVSYTGGVKELTKNYRDLDDGISQVSSGTSKMNEGVAELHKGTSELASSTKHMPDEMEAEIEEMLADYEHDDFEQVSFVSEKNEPIHVVQFVLQTEKIELDTEEVEKEVEKKENMWQRFLNLFRK